MPERLHDDRASLGRARFEDLLPGLVLGSQPFEGLPAELRFRCVIWGRLILNLPGGGEGRSAGGIVSELPLPRFTQRRVETRGCAKLGHCALETAFRGQGHTEVVMGPAVVGVQLNRLSACLNRLVVATEISEQSAVVRVEPAVIGRGLNSGA